MAQPVNTFDSHDMRGIREELADTIDDVTPDETPLYSALKKRSVGNTYYEWQTDALRASADNAHIEGDDTVATPRTATVRLGNYTQIFKDAVVISGTDGALDKAGRGKEMMYQLVKVGAEVKLDIERALFANVARAAGSSVLPRRLAGLGAWLATNTSIGASGADPTGDGTNARTDGTQRAFSQALFDQTMQDIWASGGKADKVFLSSFAMNLALGFVGNNAQRNTVSADKVSRVMDVYVTPWGTVEWTMCRENRARDAFILQTDKFEVGVLRPWKEENLAKTGDSERKQIVTELTLVSKNERASGAVYDITVA